MEKTLPPLVSDAKLQGALDKVAQFNLPSFEAMKLVRDAYEGDRAKTREVVQSLVDALKLATGWLPYHERMEEDSENKFDATDKAIVHALALAKSKLQIEPTK